MTVFIPRIIDPRITTGYHNYMDADPKERFVVTLFSAGGNIFIPHKSEASVLFAFTEYEEAFACAQDQVKIWGEQDCWVILKNADFTEGRGPMLLHKLAHNYDAAIEYIKKQDGIYGSSAYMYERYGVNINNEFYGSVVFNGYDIRTSEYID